MTPEQTAAFHAANAYANACMGATQAEVEEEYDKFMGTMTSLIDFEQEPYEPLQHNHGPHGLANAPATRIVTHPDGFSHMEAPQQAGVLERLRIANRQRVALWHRDFSPHNRTFSHSHWTAADWSNAMQGEAGEAGNKVKKLRRIQTAAQGNRNDETITGLILEIIEEVADVVTYGDLLCTYLSETVPHLQTPTLAQAVVAKFNKVSERMDMLVEL